MAAFLTHQQKVLRLYKRALRHLESWCIFRDRYRFFACMLRAQFEEHKDEKDMVKATKLLMAAEEEFWEKQHPQPYIFPDAPGGTSYERYDCYKKYMDKQVLAWFTTNRYLNGPWTFGILQRRPCIRTTLPKENNGRSCVWKAGRKRFSNFRKKPHLMVPRLKACLQHASQDIYHPCGGIM